MLQTVINEKTLHHLYRYLRSTRRNKVGLAHGIIGVGDSSIMDGESHIERNGGIQT